ncbi:MAG: DUF1501 domain-containing protein [Bacteroidota bacterium]
MERLQQEWWEREQTYLTRRQLFRSAAFGIGGMALGMLGCNQPDKGDIAEGLERALHLAPRARRVIFLHMAGAPSQLELFDYKPELAKLDGRACPPSFLAGKRFAFIKGVPEMLGPQFRFAQHGESRSWVSELLPEFSKKVDEVTFLKAVKTEEFNHAPAQLFLHTGGTQPGKPSFGSWVTYGLGTDNDDLPGFIVLVSGQSQPSGGKSLWGSGFLPSNYQGVEFRSQGDPVLYVNNPAGVSRDVRRRTLDAIGDLNRQEYAEVGDPDVLSRIEQYELSFRMQMTVPEATDISREPAYIHELYGTRPGETAFANNCLLARRLAERGVRFIQLYHRGWDSHGSNDFENLHGGFKERCREIDRPMSALLTDLKQRGMLEDTLLVWGGEFGRTPMQENRGGVTNPFKGRDHHGEAFTMWMAGGGLRPGYTHGATDEFGYYGTSGQVHVHDLQATILHQLGVDHTRLTYPFQGRDFRLTDVHGYVVKEILG